MASAYKCDGCGTLFEKQYAGWNRYMDLGDKERDTQVRVYLGLYGKGEGKWDADLDVCNECLLKITANYFALIGADLRKKEG